GGSERSGAARSPMDRREGGAGAGRRRLRQGHALAAHGGSVVGANVRLEPDLDPDPGDPAVTGESRDLLPTATRRSTRSGRSLPPFVPVLRQGSRTGLPCSSSRPRTPPRSAP